MRVGAKIAIVLLVGIIVSAVVLVVVIAALAYKSARGPVPLAHRDELRVLMDTGSPPWTGLPPMFQPNEAGEPDGFDYRLAQRIAADLGIPRVKILHSSYMDFASRLASDPAVDLVISGYVPYEAPGIAWSDPYLEFGLCLVVSADSPIQSIDDLAGKHLAIFPDDAAEAAVRRLAPNAASLSRVENGYFDRILAGELDALIYDYPFAAAELSVYYTREPHQRGKLRIAQYNLTASTYNVAVRADDPALLAAVNRSIADWRQSPDYAGAVKEFLSGLGAVALTADPGQRTHTVGPGETLATIAAATTGDPARWQAIWALNKSRLPNPNLLTVGDVLLLP